MKYYAALILICITLWQPLAANAGGKNELPKTERELIDKILSCMQYQDTVTYTSLFPTFDTLWKQIYDTATSSTYGAEAMRNLMEHPEVVQQFDPYYNHGIVAGMAYVLRKGEDSGIHWGNIVFANYELQKIKMTRDLVGYGKIAPIRFQGYVYIRDMVTRKTFMFTITEMQQINGYWYGGQVLNIFEASSIGEFDQKLMAEERRRKMLKELGLTEEDIIRKKQEEAPVPLYEEDEEMQADGLAKRQVLDRKLFSGMFDKRIPVVLYIRYLRGACPQRICMWDALYRIGNQEQYIRLKVSRTPDGKWIFNEDPTVGSMELELNNGIYTGSWMSGDNQTGYDVTFEEIPLRPAHAAEMDEVIQNGTWAKEPQIDKKKNEESMDYVNDDDDEEDMPEDMPPPPSRKHRKRR